MRARSTRWLARLTLPLLLAVAGCPPGGDDDTAAGDDDSAAGDDDSAVADDDSGDDDNMDFYGVRTDNGVAPRHPRFLRGLRLA